MLVLCILLPGFMKLVDGQMLLQNTGQSKISSYYPWLVDTLTEARKENANNYNNVMKTLNMCTMQAVGYKQTTNAAGSTGAPKISPKDFYTGITQKLSEMSTDSQNQKQLINNITDLMETQMGRIDEIERQNLKLLAALKKLLLSVNSIAFGSNSGDGRCSVDDFKCKENECKTHSGYVYRRDNAIGVCLKFISGFSDINVTRFAEKCAKDGGMLLKIDGYEKHQIIIKYLGTLSFGDPQIIIQGNDKISEGAWEFDDGTKMTYLPWYSGQPNSYSGEQDHIGMKKSFSNYKWGDIWRVKSGFSAAYLCEIVV